MSVRRLIVIALRLLAGVSGVRGGVGGPGGWSA